MHRVELFARSLNIKPRRGGGGVDSTFLWRAPTSSRTVRARACAAEEQKERPRRMEQRGEGWQRQWMKKKRTTTFVAQVASDEKNYTARWALPASRPLRCRSFRGVGYKRKIPRREQHETTRAEWSARGVVV
ncbi:unnamed protein product [Lampetra fluviatilis]